MHKILASSVVIFASAHSELKWHNLSEPAEHFNANFPDLSNFGRINHGILLEGDTGASLLGSTAFMI